MSRTSRGNLFSLFFLSAFLLFSCLAHAAAEKEAASGAEADAAALQAKYEQLADRLAHNQFGRPLYLESEESSSNLKGEIYARVDYPFATVKSALSSAPQWCEVLILHLNIKYCRASEGADGHALDVRIGRKQEQQLEDAQAVRFSYSVAAASPGYFKVLLGAEEGPLSTHDYRIALESIPVGANRSFLHLTYSYSYGFAGRVALKGYLATAGSDKVGFTQVKDPSDGQPRYIGGVRGVLERNTMRYYLAIDSYLGALSAPPGQQLEKRLQSWFASTERYARQLHEVERDEYLEMKRNEYQRQRSAR